MCVVRPPCHTRPSSSGVVLLRPAWLMLPMCPQAGLAITQRTHHRAVSMAHIDRTASSIMTGPGSVTEANAGALNSTANGFNTYLVP